MKGKAGEPTTFGQLKVGDLFIVEGGDILRRKTEITKSPIDGRTMNYEGVFYSGNPLSSGHCPCDDWPVIPLVEDEE